MVTTLQAKDLPEPWFPQKKPNSSIRQGKHSSKSKAMDDLGQNTEVQDSIRRRRGRPKLKAASVDKTATKRRGRRLPPSTTDVVMALSKTPMPDVNELCVKRDRDAIACGRTVRTITSLPERKTVSTSLPTKSSGAGWNYLNDLVPEVARCRPAASPRNCLEQPASPENNVLDEDVPDFLEAITDYNEPVQCKPHEQNVVKNGADDGVVRSRKMRSTIELRNSDLEVQTDDYEDQRPQRKGREVEKSPSLLNLQFYNRYEDREVHDYELSREKRGRTCGQRRFHESFSTNFQRHGDKRFGMADSRSSAEGKEKSQPHCRDAWHSVDDRSRRNYNASKEYRSRRDFDMKKSKRFSNEERGHHEPYQSYSHSSVESTPRRTRSASPRRHRQAWERTVRGDPSRSPPRKSTNRSDCRALEWPLSIVHREELITPPSPAVERRERRRRQAKQEMVKAQRQKDGKKPFYLTLNDQGEPYGPGKPAWMAEINKLAAGLDPSCTHIQKQTFEDVQTFKDRLNENFDYSGTLNDDYLRGLMGKAVTKKRSELIAVINSNGKQPIHIDEEVWRRLEKLANSKQRQEKSEQGRYANACRRTMGRTGSIGINGVREKLRSRLNRSPDPDKILEEMHRDKGYGGGKSKARSISVKKGRSSPEFVLSDEDLWSGDAGEFPDRYSFGTRIHHQPKRYASSLQESSGGSLQYGIQEMDVVYGSQERRHRNSTMPEEKKLSRDEYIQTLKHEIQRLKDESGKASTSNNAMKSQSAMCNGYGSSE